MGGWAQACLVAFAYLEWYRAAQLGRPGQPPQGRRWWEWQRGYGLGLAAWQRAEEQDLSQPWRRSGSQAGRQRPRRALRQAQPREYRPAG